MSKLHGPLPELDGVAAGGCKFYRLASGKMSDHGWQSLVMAKAAMREPFDRRWFAAVFVGTLVLPWGVIAYATLNS